MSTPPKLYVYVTSPKKPNWWSLWFHTKLSKHCPYKISVVHVHTNVDSANQPIPIYACGHISEGRSKFQSSSSYTWISCLERCSYRLCILGSCNKFKNKNSRIDKLSILWSSENRHENILGQRGVLDVSCALHVLHFYPVF